MKDLSEMTEIEKEEQLKSFYRELSVKSKDHLYLYALALQQGEDAIKEEKRTQKGRYCHEGV